MTNRSDLDLFVTEVLRGSDSHEILAAIRMQRQLFPLCSQYHEKEIFAEAYIRAIQHIDAGNTIIDFPFWLKKTTLRIIREQTKKIIQEYTREISDDRTNLPNPESILLSDPYGILATIRNQKRQFSLDSQYHEKDIFVEAYIRAIQKIDAGLTIANFPAWFKNTTFNIIREYARKVIQDGK